MTKEIKIAPINMGGGKAGALSSPPPVPVNGDVYVSSDKPYTLRLNVAVMNRLEAYCKAAEALPRGMRRGKGAIISDVLAAWLDEQDRAAG